MPADHDVHVRAADAAARTGDWPAALTEYRRAANAEPRSVVALNGLGHILRMLGRPAEAVDVLLTANNLAPASAAVLNNLGMAYRAAGDVPQALTAFQQAAVRAPDLPEPLNNLANLFRDTGDLDRAERCLRRAIALRPADATLLNNLGGTLERQARVSEALEAYRRATELNPADPRPHDNLLYLMHFDECFGPFELRDAHEAWRRRHVDAIESVSASPPLTDKPRLRIGFVSPDLREHAVGRFIAPLLEHLDRARFETACYSNFHGPPDSLTHRLRNAASLWRNIYPLSDDAAAAQIRADEIDILIDLSMHMAGNRLPIFARRPAPVQATYLAYCGTTGLKSIAWRISDPHLDPPGTDADYSEQTIRLPHTYWCYEAPTAAVVAPLPATTNGHVTFGCLNNFTKISPSTRQTWMELLRRLPASRLLLHAGEGAHRGRLHAELESGGIPRARVTFENYVPLDAYLALYNQIDIALDPFPYAGGTTTCDALWMGVPTVTLAGQTPVSRGGASILTNVRLPELIASSTDDYVRAASSLAQDLPRLKHLRQSLRTHMQSSPLMNAPRFAQDFASALENMWRAPRL